MATLSNTAPPSGNDYGGDEISALVLDPGSCTTRAGFAGEDVPKSVVPTSYARTPSNPYIFGDNAIHTPLPNIEIHNPMASDGTVADWDAAAKLWEYAISSRLTTPRTRNPLSNGLNDAKDMTEEDVQAMNAEEVDGQERMLADTPLLMTETGWNAGKNREKSIEVAMEEWGCPAFWLARSGVLSAFAAGKPSALVIDVGASSTSVTPVHDGLILRKGVSRTPLAGDFISQQLRLLFSASNPPIPLTPHYLVTSKTPVDAGAPAAATYRTFPPGAAPSPSFRRFEEERLLLEFKESVVQVWQGPGRLSAQAGGNSNSNGGAATPAPPSAPGGLDDTLRTAPRPFEMPDGFNQVFTADRYRAVEALFDPKAALVAPDAGSAPPPASQALLAVIQHALAQVDVDVRPLLLGNVVVVGATSLTQGFTERLNQELMGAYPGPRVRIQAPGNLYERRFASWIGGSILASLGTFHQMWISKKEYDEQGPSIVEKRCK